MSQKQKLGQMIGHGFQGRVFASSIDDKKVIKQMQLQKTKGRGILHDETSTIEFMLLASKCGVGPQIYEIFYSDDGKKIYIEMERVQVMEPTDKDVDQIIELYETMCRNKFLTFDFQFAKRISGNKKGEWVIIDYGISKKYKSYQEAVDDLIHEGALDNTGLGYFNKKLKLHFLEKVSPQAMQKMPKYIWSDITQK